MHTPGLTDLQVNGYAGVDFNDAGLTPDALDQALHAMLLAGVTRCLPTLITAPADVLRARFAALDRAVALSRLGPAMVPGFHLEGPFLNPAEGYAGCHPPEAMVFPSPALLDALIADLRRPVLLLTLAADRDGAPETIAHAARRNILVALGHTGPDTAAVQQAVAAGARLCTHLGNGMPRMLHKFTNPLWAQLAEDGLTASFIADGIHIPPQALKIMLRAKTLDRAILVTDATSAAATPPGLYDFAGMRIEHAADGSVRVPGAESLAGSALRLDQAIRNVVTWGLATAEQAIAMASTTPNALLASALDAHGIAAASGSVGWSSDLHVLRAEVGGYSVSNPR